jgi:hypothetical protein
MGRRIPVLNASRNEAKKVSGGNSEVAVVAKASAPSEKKNSVFELSNGVKNGIASGLAAAFVKTLLQPLDTIKTVQQAQKMGVNPIKAIQHVVATRGIGGLWAGIGVTVLGKFKKLAASCIPIIFIIANLSKCGVLHLKALIIFCYTTLQ